MRTPSKNRSLMADCNLTQRIWRGPYTRPHIYKVKGMLTSLCIRYHLINKSSAEKGMADSPETPTPALATALSVPRRPIIGLYDPYANHSLDTYSPLERHMIWTQQHLRQNVSAILIVQKESSLTYLLQSQPTTISGIHLRLKWAPTVHRHSIKEGLRRRAQVVSPRRQYRTQC